MNQQKAFNELEDKIFESIEHETILNWFKDAEYKRIAEYELNRIMEGYDMPTKTEWNRKVNSGFLVRDCLT